MLGRSDLEDEQLVDVAVGFLRRRDRHPSHRHLVVDVRGVGRCRREGVDAFAEAIVAVPVPVALEAGDVDVVPVRWTGPSFNPESAKVATETLEIAHHGFIDAKAKPSGQN